MDVLVREHKGTYTDDIVYNAGPVLLTFSIRVIYFIHLDGLYLVGKWTENVIRLYPCHSIARIFMFHIDLLTIVLFNKSLECYYLKGIVWWRIFLVHWMFTARPTRCPRSFYGGPIKKHLAEYSTYQPEEWL